jgi:hypothetical protein
MKWLSPANITAFLVFSASAIINYFGSSPKILYLPAFALCLWIIYQTHAYVSSKERGTVGDAQSRHMSTTATVPSTSIPTPTPVVTAPAPAIVPPIQSETASPAATVPTPESTPARSIELTASPIWDRIESASPNERDEVAAAFNERPFNDTLFFRSASRIGMNKEVMLVFFRVEDDKYSFNSVMCEIPTRGHEHFPALNKMDRFRVRGKIKRASTLYIEIKDASIEPLQD